MNTDNNTNESEITLNIHPDFQHMPSMRSVSNRWLLAAINQALMLGAAIKWLRHRRIVTRKILTGPDGGHFSIWLIEPEHLPQPHPALIYLHGSGFMIKHVPQHIENAVRYARESRCALIFVDYRLAPRHRFPVPFDDCYTTLTWTLQNAESLGIDSQRLAIGGDSAGGALAAAVAQKAVADNIALCGQLLVYPITDSRCSTRSSTAFANVPPFRDFSMPQVWETYLGELPRLNPPPYASPMHGNLTGLPATYLETEQYDPWCDEGAAYAEAMAKAGIDVELHELQGTVHGFDAFAPDSAVVEDAIARRVGFLKRIFQ